MYLHFQGSKLFGHAAVSRSFLRLPPARCPVRCHANTFNGPASEFITIAEATQMTSEVKRSKFLTTAFSTSSPGEGGFWLSIPELYCYRTVYYRFYYIQFSSLSLLSFRTCVCPAIFITMHRLPDIYLYVVARPNYRV